MKLYLSGPMRGRRLHNFPLFFRAALELRERGHQVVNPAERDMAAGFDPSNGDLAAQGIDVRQLFAHDFEDVLGCDAVVLLPEWDRSQGARAERVVAHFAGRHCYDYAPELPERMRPSAQYEDPEIIWRRKP